MSIVFKCSFDADISSKIYTFGNVDEVKLLFRQIAKDKCVKNLQESGRFKNLERMRHKISP